MKISIKKPDDWHLHLRDGRLLEQVAPHSARQFARALIMPNLVAPVRTVNDALAYRQRIIKATGKQFTPLMALYLTDNTTLADIKDAAACEHVLAFKLYPAGATTNADFGVTDMAKIMPLLESMAHLSVPLCVHGESTKPTCDVFDREKVYIDEVLRPLVKNLPQLRLVLEHISTKEGVDFVASAGGDVSGSLTAHHLLANRNAIFKGGLNPHNYCLPILKREEHRLALIKAAVSGNKKFFAGTDSAPHTKDQKQSACGCAGIYTAHAALELYAEVFANHDALDKLEQFVSVNGADFYKLAVNQETIKLEQKSWQIPDQYFGDENTVIPFRAGQSINWRMV